MTHRTLTEEVMRKIKAHLNNHLKRVSKDMGVTERVWKILEPKKGRELEKTLHPRNFARMLNENGYKIKLYHWESGPHAFNQLYWLEIKITQQDGKSLPVNMREVVAGVYRAHRDCMNCYGHRIETMKISDPENLIPDKDSISVPTGDTLLKEYIIRGPPNPSRYPHHFRFTVITLSEIC